MGVSVADITEIATGLGMLVPELERALGDRPSQLRDVPDSTWTDLVDGHVEIRWSHGRFNGFPEAKVYLDTPHADVPGYYPLVGSSDPLTLL